MMRYPLRVPSVSSPGQTGRVMGSGLGPALRQGRSGGDAGVRGGGLLSRVSWRLYRQFWRRVGLRLLLIGGSVALGSWVGSAAAVPLPVVPYTVGAVGTFTGTGAAFLGSPETTSGYAYAAMYPNLRVRKNSTKAISASRSDGTDGAYGFVRPFGDTWNSTLHYIADMDAPSGGVRTVIVDLGIEVGVVETGYSVSGDNASAHVWRDATYYSLAEGSSSFTGASSSVFPAKGYLAGDSFDQRILLVVVVDRRGGTPLTTYREYLYIVSGGCYRYAVKSGSWAEPSPDGSVYHSAIANAGVVGTGAAAPAGWRSSSYAVGSVVSMDSTTPAVADYVLGVPVSLTSWRAAAPRRAMGYPVPELPSESFTATGTPTMPGFGDFSAWNPSEWQTWMNSLVTGWIDSLDGLFWWVDYIDPKEWNDGQELGS